MCVPLIKLDIDYHIASGFEEVTYVCRPEEGHIFQFIHFERVICETNTNTAKKSTFPEFHFETEAKVDFPSACI